MGAGPEQDREDKAGFGSTLLFAILWLAPLGALTAFAAIDALRAGAANAFRYVGF